MGVCIDSHRKCRNYADHRRTYGIEKIRTIFPLFLDSNGDGEGSWIPCGGSRGYCPENHFAIRWIFLTTVLMGMLFESEIVDGVKELNEDRGWDSACCWKCACGSFQAEVVKTMSLWGLYALFAFEDGW